MQNTKVVLYEWPRSHSSDNTDLLSIDWPTIHKSCGLDHIKWIEEQNNEQCQLSLEILNGQRRLIVEFFDKTLERTYHLMWAK